MLKELLFLTLLALCNSAFSQTNNERTISEQMGEVLPLKIQVPGNYASNNRKSYPVLFVLDVQSLFETEVQAKMTPQISGITLLKRTENIEKNTAPII